MSDLADVVDLTYTPHLCADNLLLLEDAYGEMVLECEVCGASWERGE